MKKKFVYIPEGKVLVALSGGYVFVGPEFVSLSARFRLPPQYTDGDPLVYTEKKVPPDEKSDQTSTFAPSSVDPSEGRPGAENSGKGSGDLRAPDAVRERTSENHESEGVHGEHSDAQESGVRLGEDLPSKSVSPEVAEDASAGGRDSDSLGNKTEFLPEPEGDSGTAGVDYNAGW